MIPKKIEIEEAFPRSLGTFLLPLAEEFLVPKESRWVWSGCCPSAAMASAVLGYKGSHKGALADWGHKHSPQCPPARCLRSSRDMRNHKATAPLRRGQHSSEDMQTASILRWCILWPKNHGSPLTRCVFLPQKLIKEAGVVRGGQEFDCLREISLACVRELTSATAMSIGSTHERPKRSKFGLPFPPFKLQTLCSEGENQQ